MKEIVVVEKDRVGLLADISDALGKADVNIESISADLVGKNAVIRLIVGDGKKGEDALKRAGFKPVSSDTIIVTLDDQPGELSRVARALSDAGVNMTNIYHIGKEKGKALIAIKVEKKDYEKAHKLLTGYA